uniref:Multidrug transporter n=1 Tax=Candidatus Desulfatibia profunda TaxID=2841695 RepID=A0A8J6NTU5_9BACT|nr:hypothetical protein [Candidatus Desulfatibia profunda]
MHKIIKQSTGFFLIAILIFIPFATAVAADSQPSHGDVSAGAMTVDLLLIRPVGIVSLVLGSAVFIVALPFSALGGNTGKAAKKLIAEPAKFTFNRPLGEF